MEKLNKLLLLSLALLLSCCGRRDVEKTKNSVKMGKNRFYYGVTCSAPKLAPGEYVSVEYIGESGTFSCFGNEFTKGGMGSGFDGVCRSRSSRYLLPRAIEAVWVSYTDRKVYKFSSLIPYDTILALFKDGGVPCPPPIDDPSEDDFTEEELALMEKSGEHVLSEEEEVLLGEVYEKDRRRLRRIDCFDLCFLPGGKAVLFLKSSVKTILLDWSAEGVEVTDDEVLSRVYGTYGVRNMENYYDVFYSERFEDYAQWRKYMREHGSIGPLLERYLERFNYTLEFEFEDKTASIFEVDAEYTNGEGFYPTERFNEVYKMPARMTESRMDWKTRKKYYTCFMYFEEAEVLRAYDEAFGADRTQKGELRIKVGRRNDQFDISLNVGGKSVKLEKTAIRVFVDPIENPHGPGELLYKNYKGDHTNFFADHSEYLEEPETDIYWIGEED